MLARSFGDLFDGLESVTHIALDPAGVKEPKVKVAGSFAATTRVVCERCNNGWMNQLDREVRPWLAAFVEERTVEIPARDQTLLARWALKVVLLQLSRYPREGVGDRVLCRALYALPGVPRGVQVWLGTSMRGEYANFTGSGLATPLEPTLSPAFAATQLFGYAIFEVLWHGTPAGELRTVPGHEGSLVVELGAGHDAVAWPLAQRVDPLVQDSLIDLIAVPPATFGLRR